MGTAGFFNCYNKAGGLIFISEWLWAIFCFLLFLAAVYFAWASYRAVRRRWLSTKDQPKASYSQAAVQAISDIKVIVKSTQSLVGTFVIAKPRWLQCRC